MSRKNPSADKTKSLRATNIELFSREISASSNDEKIYSRDADNLYPLRIDKIINNSSTARRTANLMAKFILGNGNKTNFVINGAKTINDILKASSNYISRQYGVYFLLKYKIDTERSTIDSVNFKISDTIVLDYIKMAKSKEDDDEFPGKYYVLKEEPDKGLFAKTNEDNIWYYPYNSNPEVIKAQMLNDCKLKDIENPTIQQMVQNYRGQVYYMNLTPEYIYALPLVDSVYNDCDTEYRMGLYNNTQTRTGFLGKTVYIRFDGDDEDDDEFEEKVQSFLGAENSSDSLSVRIPQNAVEDLEKAFVVKQLKPQFDDKLFESTVKNMRQNIMGAFNNAPEPLVFANSGALFGPNAESYNEMKKFYWEQNESERSTLEQTLRMFGYDVEILPIKGVEQVTNTGNGLQ